MAGYETYHHSTSSSRIMGGSNARCWLCEKDVFQFCCQQNELLDFAQEKHRKPLAQRQNVLQWWWHKHLGNWRWWRGNFQIPAYSTAAFEMASPRVSWCSIFSLSELWQTKRYIAYRSGFPGTRPPSGTNNRFVQGFDHQSVSVDVVDFVRTWRYSSFKFSKWCLAMLLPSVNL